MSAILLWLTKDGGHQFIVKNLFYLKFFITFINATKVYSVYTLILGHIVFRV